MGASIHGARRRGWLELGALLGALLACGGSTKPLTTPSGGQGYQVKCKNDRADCLAEAGELCAGPYYVVSEDQHWGGVLADALPGPVPWWTMTVGCGQAPAGHDGPSRTAMPPPPPPANPFAGSGGTDVRTGRRECTSNMDCDAPARCAKPAGSYRGICGRPVDDFGGPSSGSTVQGCSWDTDCGVGWRCVKPSGSINGVCAK